MTYGLLAQPVLPPVQNQPPLWIRSTNFCENFCRRCRLHLSSSKINRSDKSGQPANELCEAAFVTSDAPTDASGLTIPRKRQDRRECSDPVAAKFWTRWNSLARSKRWHFSEANYNDGQWQVITRGARGAYTKSCRSAVSVKVLETLKRVGGRRPTSWAAARPIGKNHRNFFDVVFSLTLKEVSSLFHRWCAVRTTRAKVRHVSEFNTVFFFTDKSISLLVWVQSWIWWQHVIEPAWTPQVSAKPWRPNKSKQWVWEYLLVSPAFCFNDSMHWRRHGLHKFAQNLVLFTLCLPDRALDCSWSSFQKVYSSSTHRNL